MKEEWRRIERRVGEKCRGGESKKSPRIGTKKRKENGRIQVRQRKSVIINYVYRVEKMSMQYSAYVPTKIVTDQ